MEETVAFFPEGLLHKFGFGDGDQLTELTEDEGLDVDRDDLLILVVTRLVVPRLDQRVTTYTLTSMHNPVRALTVDGAQADIDTVLTPERVEVPVADILTLARALAQLRGPEASLGLGDLVAVLTVVGVPGLLDVLDVALRDHPGDATFGALRAGVLLSGDVLESDPAQLPAQLLGRLRSVPEPGVQRLVAEADRWPESTWLRPLTTSLTPPGGRLCQVHQAHPDEVGALAVTGDRVASGSYYRDVRVWDLHRGTEVGHFVGERPESSHPEGAGGDAIVSLAFTGDTLLAASADRCVYRLDPATGRTGTVVVGETDNLFAVAVSGEGVAVAAPRDIWGGSAGELEVWDDEGNRRHLLPGAEGMTAAAVLSADGRVAVTSGKDGSLLWWQVRSGRLLSREAGVSAHGLALSPNGAVVAVGGPDGAVTVRVRGERARAEATTLRAAAPVRALAFLGTGRLAAGSTDGSATVWEVSSGRLVAELAGQGAAVTSVAGSDDGRWVATGATDGRLRLWDLHARPGAVGRPARIHRAAVTDVVAPDGSTDGATALTRSADGTVLRWDVTTGTAFPEPATELEGALAPTLADEIARLDLAEAGETPGEKHTVTGVAVSADGSWALTAAAHWATVYWRLGIAHETSRVTLWHRRSPARVVAEVARDLVHGGHVAAFRCVALDRHGSLGAAGSDDGTVRLWDLTDGSLLGAFTGESAITACALSADGRLLVAGEASGRVHLLRIERA